MKGFDDCPCCKILEVEIERLRKAGYGGLHYDLAEAQRQEIERLRALLQELIDVEGPQPGTADWAAKVRDALGIDEDDGDHRFNKNEYT